MAFSLVRRLQNTFTISMVKFGCCRPHISEPYLPHPPPIGGGGGLDPVIVTLVSSDNNRNGLL